MLYQAKATPRLLFQQRRLEIKYLIVTVIVLVATVLLTHTSAVANLEAALTGLFRGAITFGMVGVFVAAVLANAAFFIHVPYTAMMLVVAATMADFMDRAWLGLAAGLGAGVGEILSYLLVGRIAHSLTDLQASRFVQWLHGWLEQHPYRTPLAIFIGAITPLPDDLLLVPLALADYPVRRLIVPLFLGKIMHTLALVVVIDWLTFGPAQVGFDFTIGVLVLAIVVALYRSEKQRTSEDHPVSTQWVLAAE